jgi:hypothetical protein
MVIVIPAYWMISDSRVSIIMEQLYAYGMFLSIAAAIIKIVFLVDYPESPNDLDKIIWIAKINSR